MSIQKKLVLLNSIISIVLVIVSIVSVFTATVASKKSESASVLETALISEKYNLVDEDGEVIVSDDISFVINGVSMAVYSADGTYIEGQVPDGYTFDNVHTGSFEVTVGNNLYICEDMVISLPGRDDIILRGMLVETRSINSVSLIVISVTLITLAATGILCSFLTARNAVNPLKKLANEVDTVNTSEDLSKTINVETSDKDIKALEESFNNMMARIQDMFSHEQELTSDVSHELRTPLTILRGEAEYALEVSSDTEEVKNSLNIILKQIDRMTRMTNELLEFQRMTNSTNIEKEHLDVSSLLSEMQIAKNEKNITLKYDIEENVYLDINETLFIRMIQNLLDNAVKYGNENGEIMLSLHNNIISVKDNGIGISKEELSKIFNRFYQVDKSRNDKSLGLGLSFVKEIARLHDAKLSVKSKLGKGTEFIIDFNKDEQVTQ